MASSNPAFTNSPAFSAQSAKAAELFKSKDLSADQLSDLYRRPSAGPDQTDRMTYEDTIVKSVISFGILLVGAVVGWMLPALALPAALVGFVLALVNIFKKKPSPALVLAYAAVEGVFVGGISQYFDAQWSGIVAQAIVGTLVVVGVTLALFANGKIRASKRATKIFMVAMIGYVLFSLVNFGLTAFGVLDGFGLRSRPIGIATRPVRDRARLVLPRDGLRPDPDRRAAWRPPHLRLERRIRPHGDRRVAVPRDPATVRDHPQLASTDAGSTARAPQRRAVLRGGPSSYPLRLRARGPLPPPQGPRMMRTMALDPVETNPDLYSVVFENDRVRVLLYEDTPGTVSQPHQHPDSVMVTLSSFQRRLDQRRQRRWRSHSTTKPCDGSAPRNTTARTWVPHPPGLCSWSSKNRGRHRRRSRNCSVRPPDTRHLPPATCQLPTDPAT